MSTDKMSTEEYMLRCLANDYHHEVALEKEPDERRMSIESLLRRLTRKFGAEFYPWCNSWILQMPIGTRDIITLENREYLLAVVIQQLLNEAEIDDISVTVRVGAV